VLLFSYRNFLSICVIYKYEGKTYINELSSKNRAHKGILFLDVNIWIWPRHDCLWFESRFHDREMVVRYSEGHEQKSTCKLRSVSSVVAK
jgi:hypothetical protein